MLILYSSENSFSLEKELKEQNDLSNRLVRKNVNNGQQSREEVKKEYKETNYQGLFSLMLMVLIIASLLIGYKEFKERRERKEQMLCNELKAMMNSLENSISTGADVHKLKDRMIFLRNQIINLN